MITVDALRAAGANVDEGLARCLNNADFYLRMVNMALNDNGYDVLKAALDAGDTKAAFEAAHKLKGSLGNLSLTPIYAPVSELTELLRSGAGGDHSDLFNEIVTRRDEFLAL